MTILRLVAMLIAIGGIVDPAITLSRPLAAQVRLHVDPSDPEAVEVAGRVRAALMDRVEIRPGSEDPAPTMAADAGATNTAVAHVVVGRARLDASALTTPVSVVTLENSPALTIVAAPPAVRVPVDGAVTIPVTIRAQGLSGKSSTVVLEDAGVELARVERRWSGDGTATIDLPYLALAPGARRLTVRVEGAEGERRLADNRADVLVLAAPHEGRVAVIEPRPSWPAGFVRRALEQEPVFVVSSLLRTSSDVASRAGTPPRAITFEQLQPYDVLVVGAPEELRRAEVDALRTFAEVRGGAVILLPDRRPSGPYADLLPGSASEQLLSEARLLDPAGLIASEVVTVSSTAGSRALASLNGVPVVISWPAGEGTFIFSGALDAWRYRADPRSRASGFWRDAIMTAAVAAPPPVKVDVEPAVVRPGAVARVTARIRPTEFGNTGSGIVSSFAVEAHAIDPRGREELVRLHPTAVHGTLEGAMPTSAAGVYNVTVTLPTGARSQTSLLVAPDAAPVPGPPDVLDGVAALSGGVTTTSSDLSPLVHHLTTIPRASHPAAVHPMRSAWWMAAFVAALCGEWTMRRRGGLR